MSSSLHNLWQTSFAAFLVLTSGCGNDDSNISIQASRAKSDTASLTVTEERYLPQLTELRSIGKLDGHSPEVFGQIEGVTVDSGGFVYVLDSQYNEVRVFDPRGQFVQSVGRAGTGPGEFFVPATIVVDDSSRVYVLDRGTLRVSSLVRRSSNVEMTASFPIQGNPRDMCALGSRLYVFGADTSAVIHELTGTGGYLRSFGRLGHLPTQTPVVPQFQTLLVNGLVACSKATQMVTVVPIIFPVMRAFAIDGKAMWVSALADYQQTVVYQRGEFLAYEVPDAGWAHLALEMLDWPGRGLVVQLAVMGAEARGKFDYRHIETRLIDPHTGAELSRTSSLPRIAAIRPPLVYGVTADPFPRVVVLVETRKAEGGG